MEVLPLRVEDFDGETLKVTRTAHEGATLEGTKTYHGEHDARRTVPVPAPLAWLLEAQIRLNGGDCELLFTTPTGRMWHERNFDRDVGNRPSKPQTSTSAPTSAATATSPAYALPASTTPT